MSLKVFGNFNRDSSFLPLIKTLTQRGARNKERVGRTLNILKQFLAAIVSSSLVSFPRCLSCFLAQHLFRKSDAVKAQRLDIKKSPEIRSDPTPKQGQPYRLQYLEGLRETAAEDAARLGLEAKLRPHSSFARAPHTTHERGLDVCSPAWEKPTPGTRIHQGTQEKTRRNAITIFIRPDDNWRALRARPHLRMSHDSDAILCPLLQGLQ